LAEALGHRGAVGVSAFGRVGPYGSRSGEGRGGGGKTAACARGAVVDGVATGAAAGTDGDRGPIRIPGRGEGRCGYRKRIGRARIDRGEEAGAARTHVDGRSHRCDGYRGAVDRGDVPRGPAVSGPIHGAASRTG